MKALQRMFSDCIFRDPKDNNEIYTRKEIMIVYLMLNF